MSQPGLRIVLTQPEQRASYQWPDLSVGGEGLSGPQRYSSRVTPNVIGGERRYCVITRYPSALVRWTAGSTLSKRSLPFEFLFGWLKRLICH